MMTPEKIENTNVIPGLTSVDMRIDKDSQGKNNKKSKKKKKAVKKTDPDQLLEQELKANEDDSHIDYHA